MPVSTPRIPSGNASASTIRRRSKQLHSQRLMLSGGDHVSQLASEIKHTAGKETQKALLDLLFKDEKAVRVRISPEQSLAMKADLQIPWTKIRILRR